MEKKARPSKPSPSPDGVGATLRSIAPHCGRSGFTLLEAMVVNVLMVFLAMLVGTAWSAFGRPAAEVAARCRVVQEAHLAAASLVRDLGGSLLLPTIDTVAELPATSLVHDLGDSLANQVGKIGVQLPLRFVGRMQPDKSQLWLCFDGGPNPNGLADWGAPDTVISYEVQSNKLIRWDQNAGTAVTVARDVDRLELRDRGKKVEIKLTFKYRQITRTYTLIALDP